jgi:D-xylose transport system ATP-binding protein
MSPTSTPTAPAPAAAKDGALLSLRGISKSFGAVAALTGVDLDVAPGEVVALVGDNGAGKSTLVKVLSGVHPPDAGTIMFESREVSVPSPAAAQQLGIATVFQDLALCENLNVIENLFLGRELRALRLDEVAMEVRSRELLRQLSAKIPSVEAPVAALSGGQRQTVAIARSLLGDPKVIILDEPTAALGVAQTAEVLNLIERLRERGLGVVMISHSMADVKAVADRVAVLRLGRNNGVFDAETTSAEELVAAITGATDNVVSRRSRRTRPSGGEPGPDTGPGPEPADEPAADEPAAGGPASKTATTKGDGDE